MTAHAFSAIYLHITFHTKNNLRVIRDRLQECLYAYLTARARETPNLRLEAVGGIEDHVHLAVKVPPTLRISEWIGQMKGAASHHINQMAGRKVLQWQDGYGAVSFSPSALDRVKSYIANQAEHHAHGTLIELLERIEADDLDAPRSSCGTTSKPPEWGSVTSE